MPNRKQQRIERKRARRKRVAAGILPKKTQRRQILDEVAELGPEVAEALAYFRQHNLNPAAVRACLEGPPPWTFSAGNGDGADTLDVSPVARDMILGLMAGTAE